MSAALLNEQRVTLLDLLDRMLDKGVVLRGDITISVADVDLLYLGLKVLLSSVGTVDKMLGPAAASLLRVGGNR